MKIYTKKGDKGYTSNVLGEEISKGDMLIELNGGIDEINADIGYLRSLLQKLQNKDELQYMDGMLRDIQYTLFEIGGDVSSRFSHKLVTDEKTKFLEREIDNMTTSLKPLNNFIYYSGTEAAAFSHVTTTVTRRVERVFARVLEGKEYTEDYQYLNRLSDFLHTFARYINHIEGKEDEIMKLRK